MRTGVLLCLLFGTAVASSALEQEALLSPSTASSRHLSLLLRGSLARARVGALDAELDVLRAGIGIGWGRFGVIASTGWNHLAPSGWPGDYLLEITGRPIECDLTYGLVPGRGVGSPVIYVHGEYALLAGPYGLHGGSVGIGALWTFWAVSGGVQFTWRRSVLGTAAPWDRSRDFYSVGLTADVGGWWPIDLRPTGD